jgi:hypothetical protein
VFKKEPHLEELAARAQAALDAAQSLKQASTQLRKQHRSPAYEDLVSALGTFALERSSEIHVLRDFAAWMYARDPFAPSILYSYRVWGDTRRGDRWYVEVAAESPAGETQRRFGALPKRLWGFLDRSVCTRSQGLRRNCLRTCSLPKTSGTFRSIRSS